MDKYFPTLVCMRHSKVQALLSVTLEQLTGKFLSRLFSLTCMHHDSICHLHNVMFFVSNRTMAEEGMKFIKNVGPVS